MRAHINMTVLFVKLDRCQRVVQARARDARSLTGFENRAVGGADQVAGRVGQESIWRPVQWTPGVRANIQPGAGLAPKSGYYQKSGRICKGDFQLTELAFKQV
jgi:hypothetical protein